MLMLVQNIFLTSPPPTTFSEKIGFATSLTPCPHHSIVATAASEPEASEQGSRPNLYVYYIIIWQMKSRSFPRISAYHNALLSGRQAILDLA
jgi:hypothetical protein